MILPYFLTYPYMSLIMSYYDLDKQITIDLLNISLLCIHVEIQCFHLESGFLRLLSTYEVLRLTKDNRYTQAYLINTVVSYRSMFPGPIYPSPSTHLPSPISYPLYLLPTRRYCKDRKRDLLCPGGILWLYLLTYLPIYPYPVYVSLTTYPFTYPTKTYIVPHIGVNLSTWYDWCSLSR